MESSTKKRHVQSLFFVAILMIFIFLGIYKLGYQSGKDKALQENRRGDAVAAAAEQ